MKTLKDGEYFLSTLSEPGASLGLTDQIQSMANINFIHQQFHSPARETVQHQMNSAILVSMLPQDSAPLQRDVQKVYFPVDLIKVFF